MMDAISPLVREWVISRAVRCRLWRGMSQSSGSPISGAGGWAGAGHVILNPV